MRNYNIREIIKVFGYIYAILRMALKTTISSYLILLLCTVDICDGFNVELFVFMKVFSYFVNEAI